MDIKFVFCDGFINEEIYVSQPSNFEDCDNSNHIFKLKRTLYGLKEAPEAWYERPRDFLLNKRFNHGIVDINLFVKSKGLHILLVVM